MDSDLDSFPYRDSPVAAQSSPSVHKNLSLLPNAASGPRADKLEKSPPYFTPAPYQSKDKTVAEASQLASLVKKKLKRL
jgi:hypothetical protein